MLHESILKFLKELDRNNNKAWFDEHRNRYENARTEFIAFIGTLIKEIGSFEKQIGGFTAKDCIFRINRDVRFSKDKRPYKNNFAGYFNHQGKNGTGAGYYIHIQPGKCMLAGGIWMPEAPVLAKIRQEIDYNFDEWKKIIGKPGFRKLFPNGIESNQLLTRPPKGYDQDNPALDYLKMKNFFISKPFSDKEALSKGFEKEVAKHYKMMKPVIDFMNRSLE